MSARGGYWIFATGGLFDSQAVESPPLLHVVNLPGQNEALNAGTLCGWARFKPECAGGSWREQATSYVESGDAAVGVGSEDPQVCPRCADALVALVMRKGDWDSFKEWARSSHSPLARPRPETSAVRLYVAAGRGDASIVMHGGGGGGGKGSNEKNALKGHSDRSRTSGDGRKEHS